jgi:two-component system cell cycle response regulator CtrA
MSDLIQRLQDRLQDRVEQLEEVLGLSRSSVSRMRETFGIRPLQARTLGLLLSRDFVTRDGLYTALYGAMPESKWPDDNVLDGHLCRLRRHLRPHGVVIRTQWGEGWHITAEDKTRIRAMLDGQHEMGHRIEVA